MKHPRNATKKLPHSVTSNSTTEIWNQVIDEAVRQLQEHEALAARLRVAIDDFRNMRDRGEPLSGMERIAAMGIRVA